MSRQKKSSEPIFLYPGVSLRGGELIVWEPTPSHKESKKAAKGSKLFTEARRFTVSVDKSVDSVSKISRSSRKSAV